MPQPLDYPDLPADFKPRMHHAQARAKRLVNAELRCLERESGTWHYPAWVQA